MRFRLKRAAKVSEHERQLVLQLVASLYADVEEVPRKPPSPDKPKPQLIALAKRGAA